MEDGVRYRTIPVHPHHVDADLRDNLRPGDRVVSVFPRHIGPHGSEHPLMLCALLELRHPSWAKEGVGWVAGESANDR